MNIIVIILILITNLVMVDIMIPTYHLHIRHKKRCCHHGDFLQGDPDPLQFHGDRHHGDRLHVDPHHSDPHHGYPFHGDRHHGDPDPLRGDRHHG